MKKKFCKLSAIFIGLIMMFTVVVLPNVEAALPVDVNKKCSLEISISSHSYAKDLSKNDVQVDLYKVASISQGGNYTGLDVYSSIPLMVQDPYGDFYDIKVIGNIIDNPELVKVKEDYSESFLPKDADRKINKNDIDLEF